MRFVSSTAFWWLLLGAIIVLFYLLKIKRKRTQVPSVILWKRALDELEANAPFKKLRRNLMLVLQLLALGTIVFALARPVVTTRALTSGSTIIVIDSTASMNATDEGSGSRLDRAKQLAREMIEGLSKTDRAAVIDGSFRVAIRCPLTSDRTALATAIDEIQPTDAAGSLTDSLRLAQQIAMSQPDASIVIISDGGSSIEMNDEVFERSERAQSTEHAAIIRFIRVGRRSENVGIVAMNSRKLSGSSRSEMFASIANFGEISRSIVAELKIDGKAIDVRTIDVAAGARASLSFDSLPREGGLAQLDIRVDDDLASDNTAFAFLPSIRRTRIGVISENPFLLRALASNPDLDVSRVAVGSTSSPFDCLVTDGPLDANLLSGNHPLLSFNPPDVPGLLHTNGRRSQPEVTSVDHSHPVNAFLTYADLHVEGAPRREAASWLKPIVSAGNDPLIWAGDDGHRRVVVIGFDLAESDLPLKVEFPILLANSLSWIDASESPAAVRVLRPGQPAIISTSASDAVVTTPAGDNQRLEAREGSVVFADTLRVGKYEAKNSPEFVVSLLSESESNTMPRDSIQTREGVVKGRPETIQSELEVWRWIALLALVVLSLEWWVYHRRIV